MRRLYLALGAVALLVGTGIGAYVVSRQRTTPRLILTQINPPPHSVFEFDGGTAILSPDGSKIAFAAKSGTAAPLLWVRPLNSFAQPLKGTENALFPFWSPDGKSLAFFADGKLRRIEVSFGSLESIADASTPRGGSWGKDVIVFSPTPQSPLYRVSASGGEVQQLTSLDVARGETSHRFPGFLPDDRHFLVYLQNATEGGKNILLGSVDSKESR